MSYKISKEQNVLGVKNLQGKIVCLSAANKESRRNYEKTVLKPIELKALITKFSISNIPTHIQFASIWGVRWEKIWDDIYTNDIALFYANRRFISYGTIISKIKSKEIAEYLWDSDEYKKLVLMSPIVQIDCSREKFWEVFNYAPRLYIQGVRIPYVKRQEEIVSEFGSIKLFLEKVLNLDEMYLPRF